MWTYGKAERDAAKKLEGGAQSKEE